MIISMSLRRSKVYTKSDLIGAYLGREDTQAVVTGVHHVQESWGRGMLMIIEGNKTV